ncbi:MAG: integrase arm-type DNA-binding domain-containing protein [Pseudomonadota bacterium]
MPRVARELGPLDIKRAVHAGGKSTTLISVGGVTGLYLQITSNGAKSWILRATIGGKRGDHGLGGYPSVTLAAAREKAREARDKIDRGIDPIAERKAAKAALTASNGRGLTFAEATDRYLAAKLDGFENARHKGQWRATLRTYAIPTLGPFMVSDIGVHDVLRALQPIWMDKTETAKRVRGRIEAVLSWATVSGHRAGDNPARWAGNLKELLPAASKVAKSENQPAVALDDAPAWFAALRGREGFGARALEFATLTAARSGEVRGAQWSEIDLKNALWVISAERMKMSREHRVPLPAAAMVLLDGLPRLDDNDLVFPAVRGGMLSDMTLSATMRRIHEAEIEAERPGFVDRVSKRRAVPHGLRSTFRDWVAERTDYPGDMAEIALAHKISSAVESAYRRGDMIEKRRGMMTKWAAFLSGEAAKANIIRLA